MFTTFLGDFVDFLIFLLIKVERFVKRNKLLIKFLYEGHKFILTLFHLAFVE